MTLPPKIKQYLNDRGITDAVIEENHLRWNGMQIVIPIFDPEGKFLFNKYRRDPFGPAGLPKYTYEKGANARLYNAHRLKDTYSVIICEGEFDTMILQSRGYNTVTSTGGANTFKDEWLPLFENKEVYVCFDNDEAGMKGAVRLLTKLRAKFVVIPKQEGVKDVTDFLTKTNGSFPILLENAKEYPILSEPIPELKTIKDTEVQIRKYRYFLDTLFTHERFAKNTGQPFEHFEHIRWLILTGIGNLYRHIRKIKKNRYLKNPAKIQRNDGSITNQDVLRAKGVLIETLYSGQLIRSNQRAVGRCPFHKETNSSFTIFLNQNRFFCFGCSAGGDAIDFIAKQDNCNFITAVKKLINK